MHWLVCSRRKSQFSRTRLRAIRSGFGLTISQIGEPIQDQNTGSVFVENTPKLG
jgi:hypothetical protein